MLLHKIAGTSRGLKKKTEIFLNNWIGWKNKVIESFKRINSWRYIETKMIMKPFRTRSIRNEKEALELSKWPEENITNMKKIWKMKKIELKSFEECQSTTTPRISNSNSKFGIFWDNFNRRNNKNKEHFRMQIVRPDKFNHKIDSSNRKSSRIMNKSDKVWMNWKR